MSSSGYVPSPITPIPYEGRSPETVVKNWTSIVRTAGGDGKSEITQERRPADIDTGKLQSEPQYQRPSYY